MRDLVLRLRPRGTDRSVDRYAITSWSLGIGLGVLLGLVAGLLFLHNGAMGTGIGVGVGVGIAGVLLAVRPSG
jgi:hypothetical protein